MQKPELDSQPTSSKPMSSADPSRLESGDFAAEKIMGQQNPEAVLEHAAVQSPRADSLSEVSSAPVDRRSLLEARLKKAVERRKNRTTVPSDTSIADSPSGPSATVPATVSEVTDSDIPSLHETALFDRNQCLEFARGEVGPVLGPVHGEADGFPTRVRLPDEPLMLVDRIIALEGEALSLGAGRGP